MGQIPGNTRGHRVFAALYDPLGRAAEEGWMGRRRAALLSGVGGAAVLEIGGGTGANLPHYPETARVTVSEPDPFMRERLARKLGKARGPVEVSDAGAEALPFGDGSFDAVVSTLVLCTVPDQRAALAEIRRVLRPDGRLLFLEHVRAEDPGAPGDPRGREGRAARWQDRVEPVWRRLTGGCHPNRDTLAAMEAAGFRVEAVERFLPPVPLSGLTPHVQGVAMPRAAARSGA